MIKLLSVSEVAKLLSVKTSTIYNWVQIGYIPHVRLGRLVRFPENEIEDWLKKRINKGRSKRISDVRIDNYD